MAAAPRAAQAGTSSDSLSNYSQETKKECRKRLIEHAVKSLTIERDSSVCVERDHVQKVWDQLHETGYVEAFFSPEQVDRIKEEMRQWELFHDSQLQSRKPSDLRVCYLGGDNPTNDLKILVENGVLCQNVWAIEKDRATLEAAWQSIKKSNLRNVRLFKGDILTFMKEFEGQFDIIYFDACGTLPSSKQNTLKFIGYVFLYNKLTSPGALITNFSFPPKQEQERAQEMKAEEIEERENIMLLAKAYLKKRKLGNTLCEVTPDEFDEELAEKTDEEIYGDYINYQVIDTAFMYIPALRILSSSNKSLWDQIFIKKGDILKQLVQVLTSSPGVDEQFHGNPWIFDIGTEFSKSTNPFCKAWVNEVLPDWRLITSLKTHNIQTLLLTHILLSNSADFMHLQNVKKVISFFNQDLQSKCLGPLFKFVYPGFCDAPGPLEKVNMVTQLLYGQLAHPSFPVMHKMLSFSYTAKTRQMFADVFIFDKCRYVYEQFPTVDCSCFAILEIWQQMVFRMAVDGLKKHIISICDDIFQFCIVAHFDYRFTNVWLNIPTRQKVELVLFDKLKEKGKFSVKEQNYCEALEHYNMCLELCPRSAVILTNKALCCLKLNQPNVVLACCNEALKLEPENLKAFYRRALAFESQKNYPEAIADLERWLKIKSDRDVEQLLTEYKKLAITCPESKDT